MTAIPFEYSVAPTMDATPVCVSCSAGQYQVSPVFVSLIHLAALKEDLLMMFARPFGGGLRDKRMEASCKNIVLKHSLSIKSAMMRV